MLMQDWFSQQFYWGLELSGMWHCVGGWVIRNIWEAVDWWKWRRCFPSKLWEIPSDTVWHHRRHKSSSIFMFSFYLFIGLTGVCFTSQNSVCITYFPVPMYMPFDCLFAGRSMKWKISDFHHSVVEVFTILGCYAALTGSCKLWSLDFMFYRSTKWSYLMLLLWSKMLNSFYIGSRFYCCYGFLCCRSCIWGYDVY